MLAKFLAFIHSLLCFEFLLFFFSFAPFAHFDVIYTISDLSYCCWWKCCHRQYLGWRIHIFFSFFFFWRSKCQQMFNTTSKTFNSYCAMPWNVITHCDQLYGCERKKTAFSIYASTNTHTYTHQRHNMHTDSRFHTIRICIELYTHTHRDR